MGLFTWVKRLFKRKRRTTSILYMGRGTAYVTTKLTDNQEAFQGELKRVEVDTKPTYEKRTIPSTRTKKEYDNQSSHINSPFYGDTRFVPDYDITPSLDEDHLPDISEEFGGGSFGGGGASGSFDSGDSGSDSDSSSD